MVISARNLGVGAVLCAASLWSTTGTVQSLLPRASNPLAVAWLRLSIAGAALLAVALLQTESRRALRELPWGRAAFAGVAMATYNISFFWAVRTVGVGLGTAIAIGSAPVWATVLEATSRPRLPPASRLVGTGASVAGVGLLCASTNQGNGSTLGVAAAAYAGLSYAAYSHAIGGFNRSVPAPAVAASTFSIAALFSAPLAAGASLSWLNSYESWSAIAFLGIVATAGAYGLYTWGLARIETSTAVTLALAEPIGAWLLATVVVGEPVSLSGVVGVGVLTLGMAIVGLSATHINATHANAKHGNAGQGEDGPRDRSSTSTDGAGLSHSPKASETAAARAL